MSKVEGHAEGERGSEEVQARLYGKRHHRNALYDPFITFLSFEGASVLHHRILNTAARHQTKVPTVHPIFTRIHSRR